jgi:2',3'-cyclic-nucleotide 2'-phosphodiesterase (5'-nucleotidase family)
MCSAGDFYGGADEFNEPKSHFVARMMGYFGYDAIAVGEMDLNYGLDKLREDNEKYHLHLTCANLVSKTQAGAENPDAEDGVWRSLQQQLNTAFPPYLVVERDGVRFGFVGLLSPELKSRVAGSRGGEVEAMTYTIKDPWEVAPTVLMEARAESDVLVLLAHMDRFDLEMKLPDYPEVDLVVLGHNPKSSSNPEPVYIGAVPVYSATSQGQNVGNLRLALDSDMTIVDTNNKVRFLGDEVPDDPEVTAMVEAFDEENRQLQKVLFAKAQLKASRSSGAAADVYLGVGSCMSCHSVAFDTYTQTAHARAYKTLSSQFVHRDTNCVGCHVTGWGELGGFSGTRRLGAPVDLIDVQCEACHGPGTDHSRDGSYSQSAVDSCVKCHTKEQDPDFDFDKAWKKIAH